ncbi:MAG: MFS transporter [Rhodospirillales bacterium CG15_BIG_FIL_POST_REV_8_21_14_020_66_15]|nr:MAG: MFS transporter [Rhodospirillales bacterium CG15_BIG_FIL_POST_REV_8_21_14_020_66_15]
MVAILIPVAALFLSFGILLAGNGLQGTLLPVRADIEGFSPLEIGVMGAAFYLGYILACFSAPHVVARVGHIRSFTVFGTVASAAQLMHVVWIDALAWWGLRFITGVCLCGLYMVMESWINERSGKEHRGRILSVYQIVNLGAVTVGQLLLNLYEPAGFELFVVASVLVSVALVPVALTRTTAPQPLQQVRIRIPRVFAISPVGVIACLTVGLVNGAVWTIVPLFAQHALPSIAELSVFMSLMIVGGAVFQWPLGRWSDLVDRRWVVIVICVGGAVSGLALMTFGEFSRTAMFAFAFVYGGFTFSLYAVAIAHANDQAGPEDFVETASTLILVFSIGAVAGPLLASGVVELAGPNSFFAYSALVHVLTAAFAFYRTQRRAALPAEEKEDFIPVPRASPEIANIDPRGPDADDDPVDGDEPMDGGDRAP